MRGSEIVLTDMLCGLNGVPLQKKSRLNEILIEKKTWKAYHDSVVKDKYAMDSHRISCSYKSYLLIPPQFKASELN